MAGNEKVQEKGACRYGDGAAWIRGSMIGKGSFGSVYLATLKNPTSKYSCFPSLMAVKSAEASVSGTIQKEKEVITKLKGCPCLINCFGDETTMGDNGVMAYNLLLEYGSGGTLSDRIEKSSGKGLPEYEARLYARSILRGLNHIQSNGYVHCDLKPENILLVQNSASEIRAKIGDFGLAKRERSSKKRKILEPYWRGTPMYLSPEAVIDKVQEAPSDIWALGCIVLQMLTGKFPWDGKKSEEILEKIGARGELPKVPNEIPKAAKDFLKGCLVRKPIFRHTSEMLLNHPFVEGPNNDYNDDAVDELVEFESDGEFSSDVNSNGNSFSSWSGEDGDNLDDELESNLGEQGYEMVEKEGVTGSNINTGLDQLNEMSKQISAHCPVSFTISAGI